MTSANVLQSLAGMIASGGIEVVDCSAVLGPETPLLKLPPELARDTPPIKIHKISEYDKDGPFWAWNWLELGEHSGTHFDAPHHWLSGRDFADGYTDTLDVQRLIAPVNVIDSMGFPDESTLLIGDEIQPIVYVISGNDKTQMRKLIIRDSQAQ